MRLIATGIKRPYQKGCYGRAKDIPGCCERVNGRGCRLYGRYERDGKLYCHLHVNRKG